MKKISYFSAQYQPIKNSLIYFFIFLIMWPLFSSQSLKAQPNTTLHRTKKTNTHKETITAYQWLAKKYSKKCVLEEKGKTDSGR